MTKEELQTALTLPQFPISAKYHPEWVIQNESGPPEHMRPYWHPDIYSFHTPRWWAQLWHFSQNIAVEASDYFQDGFKIWLHWDKTVLASGQAKRSVDIDFLEADARPEVRLSLTKSAVKPLALTMGI